MRINCRGLTLIEVLMALMILFVLGQSVWLGRHIASESDDAPSSPKEP